MKNVRLQTESGFATLVALIMVAMLTLIGIAAMQTSNDDVSIAGNSLQETQSFYAAEAGLEMAAAALQTEYENTGAPPIIMPSGTDSINSSVVNFDTDDLGPPTMRALSQGTLAGLNALVKSFAITSIATNAADRSKVQLEQNFETALIPIFQFAVFYGNDLEIAPGADMSLVGRVHSNGNLWIQAGASLKLDSYMTASGDILHGRKGPGAVSSGDVSIKNAAGSYVSMYDGSDWLDAADSNWYAESVSRWDGRVKDHAHGQGELKLPLTTTDDAHAIIERYNAGANPESFEEKSSLKIIDNVVYKKVAGSWTDVTTTFQTLGILTYTADKFTDQRENQTVDVTEIDIQKLYANGQAPSNGIIYFSDADGGAGEYPGLRLKNGSTLGAPLSVISENPVYTQGDYNTVNKQPAAIMADAVTFLSNSWDDSKSALAKSNRPASQTTVNASYLTGNVETTPSVYSGGFENLPRFLEDWGASGGKKFIWRGSAVNLWDARQAIGSWNGTYYTPPKRDWAYDTMLDDPNKLPPGTPSVRVFQRTGWVQTFVGYSHDAVNDSLDQDLL